MGAWWVTKFTKVTVPFPQNIKNKTGVINDPLGQTHSQASSEHCFLLYCFSRFEKWGRTYGRTDNMCVNNYPYRPWLWVGRVDQFCRGVHFQHGSIFKSLFQFPPFFSPCLNLKRTCNIYGLFSGEKLATSRGVDFNKRSLTTHFYSLLYSG